MSFDVSIVPCGSYDMGEVRAALAAALAPLGGLDWVQPGMKIAVKVNLISAMRPGRRRDRPSRVLTALTELLQERGASVVLGERPADSSSAAHLNRVYDVCGLRQCEQARGRAQSRHRADRGARPGGRAGQDVHLHPLARRRGRDH